MKGLSNKAGLTSLGLAINAQLCIILGKQLNENICIILTTAVGFLGFLCLPQTAIG